MVRFFHPWCVLAAGSLTLLAPHQGRAIQVDGPDYSAETWRLAGGIPLDEVKSILQRKNGFLWFATPGGAIRFDGVGFDAFNQRENPGLPSNQIESLFEDRNGNLFLGHATGNVSLRLPNGFRSINLPDDWPTQPVVSFIENDGCVWAVNHAGGRLMVAQNGGCIDAGPVEHGGSDGVRELPDGWTVADDEVVCVEGGAIAKIWGPTPWRTKDQRIIFCQLRNGDVAVGTTLGGIFILHDDGNYSIINQQSSLRSIHILSLCEDAEGNLWVGTFTGITKLHRRICRSVSYNPSRLATWSCIAPKNDGGIWLGTSKGSLHCSQADFSDLHEVIYTPDDNAVRAICEKGKTVWYSKAGHSIMKLLAGRSKSVDAMQEHDDVWAMVEDSTKTLWAGGASGLWRLANSNWTKQESLEQGVYGVRCLAAADNGALWIGMEQNGLAMRLPDGTIRHCTVDDGLPATFVSSLLWEPDTQRLWIGTFGGGLAVLADGQILRVPFPADVVYKILKDAQGRLWLVTENGVRIATPEVLLTGIEQQELAGPVVALGAEEGIKPAVSVARGLSTACRTADGSMWFISDLDIVRVDPRDVRPVEREVPLFIRKLVVNGQTLTLGDQSEIELQPGVRRLDVHFSALSFVDHSLLNFKYRLLGLDDGWMQTQAADRTINFQRLPPGNYAFELLAANRDGIWNAHPLGLKLVIPPFWWQRLWFKSALIAATMALIVLFALSIADRINRQKLIRTEKMRAVEQERTRISMDLHDEVGSEMTRMSLLINRLMRMFNRNDLRYLPDQINELGQVAQHLVKALDEIVWVVSPANDNLDNLVAYLARYVSDYLEATSFDCDLKLPDELPPVVLPGPVRHNLYLAVVEALNNSVKHSDATEICFCVQYENNVLYMALSDNGKGLDPSDTPRFQRGLKGMHRRMEKLGGIVEIKPVAGGGTSVAFRVPIAHAGMDWGDANIT